MTDVTRKQSLQLAGVIAGTVVLFNVVFLVASSFYEKGKPAQLADLGSARLAFATLTIVVAATAYPAGVWPRLIGHALAVVIGIGHFIAGIAAFAKGLSPVLGLTMLVVGGLVPVLAYRSWRHSRASWSFLSAMVVVFGLIHLFGAPKLRTLLGISLWHVLIIPGLCAVSAIALSLLSNEYRD